MKKNAISRKDVLGTAQKPRPFYETAKPEEWLKALRTWAESPRPRAPLLSDDAVSRKSIYKRRTP